MAELPAAAPAGAAASEHDVLLATKLHVPRLQPGFVGRARLVAALEAGLAARLVVICAPAGAGKTALLADWARTGRRPVAWLSLDEADNDPARFWRHTVAALGRVRPPIAERVAPLLGLPAPPSFDGLVTAVINELAAQADEEEVLLVLDDYHLIDAQPVHTSLTFLLEHLPPGLHLVLASRIDPPLPLARLRAGRQLAELRAQDLRFTADEAAALLREAVGADLPGAEVAALTARAEGWAAGLQLAALSLRGQADTAGFVAAFSGSHRFVLDYLTEEVLGQQSEPVRRFLLETSVLDQLSGALCDAVTGRADSQAMLEAIERANLFLVPLDEVRGWWRYHQLFADLLRARLQQEQPGKLTGLHRAAAEWCDAHGLVDETIRHALAIGDTAWAARLIERHYDTLFRRVEGATVDRWVKALPEELLRSRPRLLLAQAVGTLMTGHVDHVDPLIAAAERALEAGGDDSFEPSVGRSASLFANLPACIALVRAHLAHWRGDAAGMDTFTRQARAHLSEDDRALRLIADWDLAMADWVRGRLAEAEDRLVKVVAEQQAAGERYLAVRPACDLGQVRQARGRLDMALSAYQHGLLIAAGAGRPLPPAGVALVGMAEVFYKRDDLSAAAQYATKGVALCRQLAYTQPLATGLATLAWIRHAQGSQNEALQLIEEAEQAGPDPDLGRFFYPVPAWRARLLLALGDAEAAARWASEQGLGPDDEPDYAQEREYLVLARVLLAQGRPGPRWHSWAECSRQHPPKPARAALSRSKRCRRSRSLTPATKTPRSTP
jgi:LuxR family transcriptional regulator, maltose regulon positive regulatory protein